jgi:hypothetical protein
MKKAYFIYGFLFMLSLLLVTQCGTRSGENKTDQTMVKPEYGGFGSQVAWGEHIVKTSGCNDCHTPKKMTPAGPIDDTTLLLSGHPEKIPPPDVDRIAIGKKGLTVTNTLTAWIGPWGVSYAANLTSDPTGIGNWQESNFITAIREGKYKGISNSRNLLPPMPWQCYRFMTDDELKAVFSYLKSTKPIKNVVPLAEPPATIKH